MTISVSAFRNDVIRKIGRCERCMRQSLAAALATWAVLAAALLAGAGNLTLALAAIVAAGVTGLWALHVAVYAGRAPAVARADRRHALTALARAAAAGALASVPVLLWPGQSLAFCGQCSKDEDCGTWKCKDTAAVGSGTTCYECVDE